MGIDTRRGAREPRSGRSAVSPHAGYPVPPAGNDTKPGPRSLTSDARALLLALGVVAASWTVLFVLQVAAHQPTVDDYGYAHLAYTLSTQGFAGLVSSVLHSGPNSPLVPLLAAPLARVGGVEGAIAVQLPVLLAVAAGAYVLARLWLGPTAAGVTAVVVALNQAVLGFAVMMNFSGAETAAILWALAAYLRSDRLSRWRWSVVFGVATAALLLSRSLAPAYAAPLSVVVAVDLALDAARHRRPWLPAAAAVALVVALAAPWWVVSGRSVLNYLTTVGFGGSGGYTATGGAPTPSKVVGRARYTAYELGWPEAAALAGALVLSAGLVLARRRRLRGAMLLVPLAWTVLSLIALSTSAGHGTGFGNPVLATAIVVAAAALGSLPSRALAVMGATAVAIVATGFAAELTGGAGHWWQGPQYVQAAIADGGSRTVDVALLNAQVARTIGRATTLVVRQDDALNRNGLGWEARRSEQRLVLPPNGPGATATALEELSRAAYLVSGSSRAMYQPIIDQERVELAAAREGFRPVRRWRLGASNSVVVWRRGSGARIVSPPVTNLFSPRSGSALKGSVFLNAGASGDLGVSRVEFSVTGEGLRDLPVSVATSFQYGWLGAWDTASVPDGTYVLRSVAYDPFGDYGRSAGAVVRVENGVR
jgi:hypothetical protein